MNDQKKRLESVILPFLGNRYLSEAPASITEYRIHRAQTCKTGKPPSRSTMHQEIVLIRQVYKCALRHKWIDHLPDFSVPYKASGKVGPARVVLPRGIQNAVHSDTRASSKTQKVSLEKGL